MTDSEKAKESLEKRKGEYWCIKTDNVYVPYTEGYKDGFAEGERIGKEKQWKATEKAQKKTSARIKELEKEIEKMKSFIHSEIDFCMYCPLTSECRNDEGTCPYAYATEDEQKNLLMDFIRKRS